MSGNSVGGKKARDTNLKRNPNFYKELGKMGGKAAKAPKGFATMDKQKLRAASRAGGLNSKPYTRKPRPGTTFSKNMDFWGTGHTTNLKTFVNEEPPRYIKHINPTLWMKIKERIKK